jgi:hypothetical protein
MVRMPAVSTGARLRPGLKLEFALLVLASYWVVNQLCLVPPLALLIGGATLVVVSLAARAVSPLFCARRVCTPL